VFLDDRIGTERHAVSSKLVVFFGSNWVFLLCVLVSYGIVLVVW